MSSEQKPPGGGVIYTETIVHSAPQAFVNDAPYQIAVITLDRGGRITARLDGDRAAIGERVEFVEHRNGIPFFRKSQ